MATGDHPTHPLTALETGTTGLDLPPGGIVRGTRSGAADQPLLWISDAEPPAALWGTLRARHTRTGLWPLLLEGLSDRDPDRPWRSGELDPDPATDPAAHDVDTVLAQWWRGVLPVEGEGAQGRAVVAPFGDTWPGLAAPGSPREDPDECATEFARFLVLDSWLTAPRIGLVPSTRGADTLADLGWMGPANYEGDMSTFSAVLRSWEERFGARVVAVGFATLYLSVAAPPTDRDHALRVAAEHFAFCPDNVWQSGTPTLATYADSLVDRAFWSFWWD
ncbi:DUF4253 domain-containing protein [Polymorphospora sp. NPDC050346]|uniref:DUF4253 domain-containing protein n=1 Tax=Polymorphospora sp. NPDC050346 TaxID=3155780 RepID=UPI0033C39B09